ncbi:MAG: nucleotidyltransferase domain-containing protein [Candidatus Scalindua sp.]|nr:nucleotidyltransferase domain-containing protein [Candidatus Scalindua sp.]
MTSFHSISIPFQLICIDLITATIYHITMNVSEKDLKLKTSRLTGDLINYIVDKIVCSIQPEKILIFGSYARGDSDQDSDLDLLVIKDSQQKNREIRREIDRLLTGRRFGIDIIVRKPEEVAENLKNRNPFYLHHIFKDGKVLYERKQKNTE